MKIRFVSTILVLAAFLLTGPGQGHAATKLSRHKDRQLEQLGSFEAERRGEFHSVMNDLFMRLWRSEIKRKTLRASKSGIFQKYPLLQLSDRDGDNTAEEFSYLTKKGDLNTKEFGFFFDLNRDGRADYVIYFGGTMMRESDKELDLWWMNYHAVDGNYDGRIDNVLYQGSSDLNGNGKIEPEVGLWLIDDDFDGKIDRAIYQSGEKTQPVEVVQGQFDFAHNLILNGKTVAPGDPIGGFWDRVLSDIIGAGEGD